MTRDSAEQAALRARCDEVRARKQLCTQRLREDDLEFVQAAIEYWLSKLHEAIRTDDLAAVAFLWGEIDHWERDERRIRSGGSSARPPPRPSRPTRPTQGLHGVHRGGIPAATRAAHRRTATSATVTADSVSPEATAWSASGSTRSVR